MRDARVALVMLVSGTAGYVLGLVGEEGLHGSLEWGRGDLERGRVGRLEDGLSRVEWLLHDEGGDVEAGQRLPGECH